MVKSGTLVFGNGNSAAVKTAKWAAPGIPAEKSTGWV